MKRILVTTDLSANSKAAIRFAIRMASQCGAELIFVHVHYVLRASTWTDRTYDGYVKQSEQNLMGDLEPFIKKVYKSLNITPSNYRIVIQRDIDVVRGIVQCANDNKCDYICISTLGASGIKKIAGTNSAELVGKSNVPVLCVPSNYKYRPLTRIMYAADLENYEAELKEVLKFADATGAAVDMVHFGYNNEIVPDAELMQRMLREKFDHDIHFHFRNRNIEFSVLQEIEAEVKRLNACVIALFTNQHRSFYQRLFLSSKTQELTFHSKTVILSYPKILRSESIKNRKQHTT